VAMWYDVSDLMDWSLPHLTGIQRTTVGILNGLVENHGSFALTRWDEKRNRWEPVPYGELPESVRHHLRIPSALTAEVASRRGTTATVPPKRRLSQRLHERILGKSSAAGELREAFREFKSAARRLACGMYAWSCVRRGSRWLAARMPAAGNVGSRTEPQATVCVSKDSGALFRAGDVLLSLGATWGLRAHAEACSHLRRHGVIVMRMIYDLIPTLKPQWVYPVQHQAITQWARAVLADSDGILTISEFSRREIERYCHESRLPIPPVRVIRLGDVLESCGDTAPPYPRFVPQRPFFVCVSTLDVRKNHRMLYDAWSLLAARDADACPDLICVGTPHLFVGDLLREVRNDRAVNGRIHFLHAVTDQELAWYYRHCAATIYPSRYEGWGLPVAESLGHGRICLASHATSIPEISGDLPEFFDPFDVPCLVALVKRTLQDREWVQQREAEIRRSFVPTPWSQTAGQILEAVAQLRDRAEPQAARGAA
jgi:glycosyltransferase involved in cell wall biosynthesis